MRKVALFLIAIFTLMVGCTTFDCSMYNDVSGNYAFKKSLKEGQTEDYRDSAWMVLMDKYISVIAVRPQKDSDSIINKWPNPKTLSIPVGFAQEEDELIFQLQDSEYKVIKEDTVKITKTNDPVFENVDCYPRYNHQVLSAVTTKNFIDSIVINNKSIDNDLTKVHFYLYLHPSD